MSRKTYQSIYYHIVFRTKDDRPYLHSDIRKTVYQYIWSQCEKLGFALYRIGGDDHHVHLLIHIPPKISVAEAISRLKGSSSHYVNRELVGEDDLYWQRGYGVTTVSRADFRVIHEYIKNQEQHHQEKTLKPEYEIVESDITRSSGIGPNTTTSRGIEPNATTPRGIEPNVTTPRGIEPNVTTPRGIEPNVTTPRGIETPR